MPCYDGRDEDARIDRETAKKVEAVLCGAVRAFGYLRVIDTINPAECSVTRQWFEGWWREHQRKDAARQKAEAARKEQVRKEAIVASGDFKRLGKVIHKPQDIMPAVFALQAAVPGGCETFSPPAPPASSGVRTTYYGDVRVVEAFDPIEGLMVRRADLYYRKKQP